MAEIADKSALVRARQKARAPELGSLKDGGRADHDKGWQILVFGPEAVYEPRAEAWPGKGLLARVHLERRTGVVNVVGDHRPDYAQVVGMRREVWEQLADLGPTRHVF